MLSVQSVATNTKRKNPKSADGVFHGLNKRVSKRLGAAVASSETKSISKLREPVDPESGAFAQFTT